MTRKKPTLSERYASVVLTLKWGDGTPVVERERAKGMTAAEIIDAFEGQVEFDHGVHVAIDGSNHPTNLTPMLTAAHRDKTNKVDIPQIAKTKRIRKSHAAHESAMADKILLADDVSKIHTERNGRKWRSAPMPGTKRSGLRKRLNGKVERRGASSSGS